MTRNKLNADVERLRRALKPFADFGARPMTDNQTAKGRTFAPCSITGELVTSITLEEFEAMRAITLTLTRERDEALAALRTARGQIVAFSLDTLTPEQAVQNVAYIDALTQSGEG